MKNTIKKLVDSSMVRKSKAIIAELVAFYKTLSPWKKVLFILVVLICKFILPDLIAFPALLKWIRNQEKRNQ